jgi:hypothetical protein
VWSVEKRAGLSASEKNHRAGLKKENDTFDFKFVVFGTCKQPDHNRRICQRIQTSLRTELVKTCLKEATEVYFIIFCQERVLVFFVRT